MFPHNAAAKALAVLALVTLAATGCVRASDAKPQARTFPFSGRTLDVTAHETPTDLVAADRGDVKVTLWFDAKLADKSVTWELIGDRLDLNASCTGLAICDAKFRVEVPRGVAVLRDGRKTRLR